MILNRANYLAEIKNLTEHFTRKASRNIPFIGFFLWATRFIMSTFRIDWQTEVNSCSFKELKCVINKSV